MDYFAHSSKKSERAWQTIAEHLENTAIISGKFASKFNARDFVYACDILHII